MYFKGVELTLVNYKEVLNSYSTDIKEVVKLAIIDNIDISDYIDKVNGSSYALLQIKISIQEGIQRRYIFTNADGDCIKLMREIITKELDVAPLNNYINPVGGLTLDFECMKCVLIAYLNNADISKIDFSALTKGVVREVCEGLQDGYPLDLFTSLSESDIALVKRGMQMGYDMTPFSDGSWTDVQILHLLGANVDFAELMSCVTSRFSIQHIDLIIDAIKCGLDIVDITTTADGEPLYSPYQMEEIILAKKNGVFTVDFLNPTLSPSKLAGMRMNLLYANSKQNDS